MSRSEAPVEAFSENASTAVPLPPRGHTLVPKSSDFLLFVTAAPGPRSWGGQPLGGEPFIGRPVRSPGRSICFCRTLFSGRPMVWGRPFYCPCATILHIDLILKVGVRVVR